MATHQELLRLNHDIEVLENAGLIKAASVLHKKFIKEAQAVQAQDGQMRFPSGGGNPNAQTGNPTLNAQTGGVQVVKPGDNVSPYPAQTPPPAPVLPPLPPGYNVGDNFYQDPKTGKTIYIDPRTGQPFEGGLTQGYGTPGTYANPGGGYYTVPQPVYPPGTIAPPTQPPANTVPPINLGIPTLKDRYDFYYGKIDQGFSIQDPQQQKEYFDRLKRQIFDQYNRRPPLIDKKTFDDLMKLFAH